MDDTALFKVPAAVVFGALRVNDSMDDTALSKVPLVQMHDMHVAIEFQLESYQKASSSESVHIIVR